MNDERIDMRHAGCLTKEWHVWRFMTVRCKRERIAISRKWTVPSITYLHSDKLFRRLGSLSTHLPRLDDAHDHLASPLDSFEGRCCRSVMIVFDSFDLLEDLCADPAHLQRQVLPFQETCSEGSPLTHAERWNCLDDESDASSLVYSSWLHHLSSKRYSIST